MANFEIKDFKNNFEEAKKWAEEKYNQWLRSLSIIEKTAISDFVLDKKFEEKVASYLEERQGHLLEKIPENLTHHEKEELQLLNFFIKRLEKALMKVKVPETIFVYKKINQNDFFPSIEPLKKTNSDEKLDLNVVKKLKNEIEHKTIVHYNFLKAHFINPSRYENDENILLKLKVSKGIFAGYVPKISGVNNKIKLLINRGYKIAFEKISIINKNGREILEIEASIIQ